MISAKTVKTACREELIRIPVQTNLATLPISIIFTRFDLHTGLSKN